MKRKAKSCDEQVQETTSLPGAMRLYQSLGDQLNQRNLDPWTRNELKACRKQLLDMYGPAVREATTYTEIRSKVSPYINVQRPKGAGVLVVVFGADSNVHKSEFIPVGAVEDLKLKRAAEERKLKSRSPQGKVIAEDTRGLEEEDAGAEPRKKVQTFIRDLGPGDLKYSIDPEILRAAVYRLATQVPVAIQGKSRS